MPSIVDLIGLYNNDNNNKVNVEGNGDYNNLKVNSINKNNLIITTRKMSGCVGRPSAFRSADWLCDSLRNSSSGVLVLDCRLQAAYSGGHVRGAINVTLPTLLLRRLANDKVTIASLIKCNESRDKFLKSYKSHTIVLCGDGGGSERNSDDNVEAPPPTTTCGVTAATLPTLWRKLEQDGCDVVCLDGGYPEFHSRFPEWCSCSPVDRCGADTDGPVIGLHNLRISGGGCVGHTGNHPCKSSTPRSGHCSSDTDSTCSSSSDCCDSCLQELLGTNSGETLDGRTPPYTEDRFPFPVEILPNLFLGNAKNSADLEALERHKIRYILNVTCDLPNIFKHDPHIRYLQIPITDHWSQNLASFFPAAIQFIDEARQKQLGVLVHCLAGVSRSVTITVAYLMHKFSMPLNDAYDFVKKRKANISPNFSFMGQLLDFERQLNLHGSPASASSSSSASMMSMSRCIAGLTSGNYPTCPSCPPDAPCRCNNGTTPDSGIDLGNWV